MKFPLSNTQHQNIIIGKIDLFNNICRNTTYFDLLYEYYFDEMPYGILKARDGDPAEWIFNKLEQTFN